MEICKNKVVDLLTQLRKFCRQKLIHMFAGTITFQFYEQFCLDNIDVFRLRNCGLI